jgi:hypothetical protein
MMEDLLPHSDVLAFLRDLADSLESFITDMERFVISTPLPGRHPELALEHGVEVHRASLRWARSTIAFLSEAVPEEGLV